jgi:anaerobic magnesium-protoporphyrin IX monomethyl ester cyclase
MAVVLINPNLVVQRNDRFTTGVVYMPIGLAYIAASLQRENIPLKVIDAFGSRPFQTRDVGIFSHLGLHPEQVASQLPSEVQVIFIYANQLINHDSVTSIITALKQQQPKIPIIVLENTQAVTAYALNAVATELFWSGADYVLSGEGEERTVAVVKALQSSTPDQHLQLIDGLSSPKFSNPPREFIKELDKVAFPAWDLFPVENYWNLRFAHGPQSTKQYLPLLTSRGCPYPCSFCVVPATNRRTWRFRSAENVADEMAHWKCKWGVTEFHLEDLNPTIQDKRTRAICQALIDRKLNITWKIVAGTKVESIKDETTIDLMAKAGCRYISISPETGSERILELIDKPFKIDHAATLIRRMNSVGIASQACFVLGFPGESDGDRRKTKELVKKLARDGVDEIALFIISPVPGSKIFEQFKGYKSLSELNFTPTWRKDYTKLNRFRLRLYIDFLMWKVRHHPRKIIRQVLNFARRRFETKMEMVPYKALVLLLRYRFSTNSQRNALMIPPPDASRRADF